MVNFLVVAQADLDKADNDGATPLAVASEKGHVEMVQALLSADANYTMENNIGMSAEDWATLKAHKETILLLQQAVQRAAQNKKEKEKETSEKCE